MENLKCRQDGQWVADKLLVCSAAIFGRSTYYIETVRMTWYDAKVILRIHLNNVLV